MIDIQDIEKIVQTSGGTISESATYPAKPAKLSGVPSKLHPALQERLTKIYPNGFYSHQSKAIEMALNGNSVCVATPTASGKTLIFTSIAISHLLNNRGTTILALYPAKALLHDQIVKWESATTGLGLVVTAIDGGIEVSQRNALLAHANIVLMTPDVLHAWLLAKLDQPEIRKFIATLAIVILDEAHIYNGVFGTNMSYLLRRLRAVSGVPQFLASSATIGDPANYLKSLTGVEFQSIGGEDDGAATPEKHFMLCALPKQTQKITEFLNGVIRSFSRKGAGRFLLFVDSRKQVEYISADSHRVTRGDEDSEDMTEDLDDIITLGRKYRVLPYRAGYEEDDRENIQKSLSNGTLIGVVTTSALELGIDIGAIDLVIIFLKKPLSSKSFWQRAGRAGRQNRGVVLICDAGNFVKQIGLQTYLSRNPEPNWLYLENEYIQYANALCAATERQSTASIMYSISPFTSLPKSFIDMLENEIEPKQSIPQDLYPIKQQAIASASPHRSFPLRSGIEKTYHITCNSLPGLRLGSLTYSQVLREGYPGAIYRYLTKPYRIFELKHAKGEIYSQKIKGIGRTSPLKQVMVFPQFNDKIYQICRSDSEFFSECRVQVSERVIGFTERWGNNVKTVEYGQGNPYSQKPIIRYIDTTGVLFYFSDADLQDPKLGNYILQALCNICAIQDQDVGYGKFISQTSPIGSNEVRGFAIYDSTYGSLRLTRQIPARMDEILTEASRIATFEGASRIAGCLAEIQRRIGMFGQIQENVVASSIFSVAEGDGWISLVSPNQPAILHDGQAHVNEDVIVLSYLFTPQGIRYTLKSPTSDVKWQVAAAMIRPIGGITAIEMYNVNTGETKPA